MRVTIFIWVQTLLLAAWMVMYAQGYNIGTSWKNFGVFAALKKDGTAMAWGGTSSGGKNVPTLSNVKAIYSSGSALAALRNDGTVAVWGQAYNGGSTEDDTNQPPAYFGMPPGLKDVKAIYSTNSGFAALKVDGTVKYWGRNWEIGSESVPMSSSLSNVKAIFTNFDAFAALKEDGTVQAWGHTRHGGKNVPTDLINVKTIYSNDVAFAALKEDGTVQAWGNPLYGGIGVPPELKDVQAIFSTNYAFAALCKDGSVEVWGYEKEGGAYDGGSDYSGKPADLSNVITIYSNRIAFAALKDDETVEVWGRCKAGGCETSDTYYTGLPANMANVKDIYSTDMAFAALKEDGTVQAWGNNYFGGSSTSDGTSDEPNQYTAMPTNLAGVRAISSTSKAFAALKLDGTVVVWGDIRYGGGKTNITDTTYGTGRIIVTGFPSELTESGAKVRAIYSTQMSFAALKEDGTLRVWGDANAGGARSDNKYASALLSASNSNVRTVFGRTEYYSDSTARNFYPCPPGYYGSGMPDCTPCPAGSSSSSGTVGFEAGIRSTIDSCVACDETNRKYSTDGQSCSDVCPSQGYVYSPPTFFNDGLPTCRRCRYLGEQYDEATSKCTLCAKGKASDDPAFQQCEACAEDTYADAEGQTSCNTMCPTDSRVPSGLGSYGCYRSNCPSGSYGKEGDAESCHDCPGGKFTSQEGLDECSPCPKGKYSKEASKSCTPCAAGSYRSEPDGAECSMCFPGTFSAVNGSTECLSCEDVHGIGFGTNGTSNSTACVFEGCDAGSRVEGDTSGNEVGCTLCSPGKYSRVRNSNKCEECPKGTYSDKKGMSQCTPCEIGKFNSDLGASEAGKCLDCTVGRYNSFSGSDSCQPCPPGSFCNATQMTRATECPVGAASLKKESEECSVCVAGRYQSESGSAACELCPAGTYSATAGSPSNATCSACPEGKFTSQPGASACSACPKGSFQDAVGQTECKECSEEYDDETLTSNDAGDGCVLNPDLQSFSLVTTIYSYGTVWVGSILIASVFLVSVLLVTYYREKEPVRLANFSRAEAAYYSFLPGFSFGSWVFLLLTVSAEDTILAMVMSFSRLLHLVGGILIVLMLFGPEEYSARLSRVSSYVKEVSKQRKYLEREFARENVYIIEMMSLLSFCDVTMFRFIPWKKSKFYTLSEGYPSMTLMNFCLVIKTVETFVSVVCDIIYLSLYGDDDASSIQRQQTQALFIINIIFGVATIVMDLLVLCVRRGMLAELKEASSSSEPSGAGAGEKEEAGAGAGEVKSEEEGISLVDLYGDKCEDQFLAEKNPLHTNTAVVSASASASVSASARGNREGDEGEIEADLRAQLVETEKERDRHGETIEHQREEIEHQRQEIEQLKLRNQELEDKKVDL